MGAGNDPVRGAVPTTIAVGVHTEAPGQARARLIGERCMLTLGDDRAGVQIVGPLHVVRLLVNQARRELDQLALEPGGGL